jgi:sugar lactone lactonase YvrE
MRRTVQRRAAVGLLALIALIVPTSVPATASPPSRDGVILLDGATATEGIAAGEGTTFYAGDRLNGDIYRGDIRDDTAGLFIDAPEGRVAIGMKADVKNDLLFVAGGGTGDAYVYSTETGETVGVAELTAGQDAFINDVTLTKDGAWFTNSFAAELYFLPVDKDGGLGDVEIVTLTGPAAEPWTGFGPNGIAAVNGGKTLILAHSAFGALFAVDPEGEDFGTAATARIEGIDVPNVDGILVQGRQLWAVQNQINQVSRIRLSHDLSSGVLQDVITSPDFNVPTTIAKFGNTLAAVNAKFGQPATEFEVVLVPARN